MSDADFDYWVRCRYDSIQDAEVALKKCQDSADKARHESDRRDFQSRADKLLEVIR